MSRKPEEISNIIKEQIRTYNSRIEMQETGTVILVGDGIARVYGLRACMASELLEFEDGVSGMALVVFVVAKIMKMPFCLSMATALTALYGFPPNAIITESVCTALAETPEEKEYLMSKMFPAMIVGGFTTVTITSVIIAGVFAEML